MSDDPASTSQRTLDQFAPSVRVVFCGALGALGVIHAIAGEAVTRMFPVWPEWVPGRPVTAHVAGALLVLAAGLALVRPWADRAAAAIGSIVLASVLLLHVPRSIPSGHFGDEWANVLKWLAMAAGAFVVAHGFARAAGPAAATEGTRTAWFHHVVAIAAKMAPAILGAFMIGAAVLHVRFAEFVALLIPDWIPWRVFWAWFTAVTLAAGGVGLVIPRVARLAAILTSVMIFSWFLLVHIPRAVADIASPVGWCELAESLAFSAMAFLLAAGRTDRVTSASGRPLQ